MTVLRDIAQALQQGETTSTELVTTAFERIDTDPALEHVMIQDYRDQALQQATAADELRAKDPGALAPFAGIPITVKDLFDIAGQSTTAGSVALQHAPPAVRTAPCIQALIDAGFIPLGRVNMTEFAYSGLGLNPHHGTPRNPCDKSAARIPGGSSSGSAVSVATGLVAASIGSDTGGSVRIPAALCGLTGFKPGSTRISREGVIPLSTTLDTIGPLANSVQCCADLYHVMSGQPALVLEGRALAGVRLIVPENVVWERCEQSVRQRFDDALNQLKGQGVEVIRQPVELIDAVMGSGVQGVFAGYEAFQWHQSLLQQAGGEDMADYDPRVRVRIETGGEIPSQAYRNAAALLQELRQTFATALESNTLFAWPTTARTAPLFSELESEAGYSDQNLLLLRNTAIGNVLDAASITLPLPASVNCSNAADSEGLPAGLMLSVPAGSESELLAVAQAAQHALVG